MSTTVDLRQTTGRTVLAVLIGAGICHMLNDTMQVLLPAIYPLLKTGFSLNFAQIGLITLVFQATGSILQPLVGLYTDRRPMPYSLPVGMGFSLIGLLCFAFAPRYAILLAGAASLGIGSSIFHPGSSRIARAASGGQHGLAQSIFQVGGNLGQALGPLFAAFFIMPHGRQSLAWFALAALAGIAILTMLATWSTANGHAAPRRQNDTGIDPDAWRRARLPLFLLGVLMLSKFFYLASFNSYYIFYLVQRFHIRVESAQIDLFVFLAAAALGTLIGGPIGDRIGRRTVIRASILGVLPFTLALPYAGLATTILLSVVIGLILSSAFAAIIVYAIELVPGRVGAVSGLFFGLAFGLAGIGAAGLGVVADAAGLDTVYRICSFLPALGIAALFLPELHKR